MDGSANSAFRALSEAVLAISGGERAVDPVLQRLALAAQRLVGARYAAIGVPDGEGGFAKFIAEGMTDAQWEALGEVPRTHGLLGPMLESSEPYRTDDIQADPRFEGWPDEHPNMRSFLGVPIVSRGETISAFYLTEKKGQRHGQFTEEDERLIITLAAHAALALERAELYERANRRTVEQVLDAAGDRSLREWGMRMLMVSRCLERIGDPAVDVGEQTANLVSGEFREFTDASHPVEQDAV